MSTQTESRRFGDINSDICKYLMENISTCKYYSLALDSDNIDSAQLKIINDNFKIAEELLDLCHKYRTTICNDVLHQIMAVLKNFNLPFE